MNNLPDDLQRWSIRESSERDRMRTDQSFCVPRAEIETQGYDLSINRYKEIVHDDVKHRSPTEVLDELDSIEHEILTGMAELRKMMAGGAL